MREERWIAVSDGTPQTWYIGKTDLTEDQVVQANSILLTECLMARSIIVPAQEGFGQTDFFAHLNFSKKPITLRVRPIAWYWLDQNEEMLKIFQVALEQKMQQDMIDRAKAAGLAIAGESQITKDGLRMKIR